MNGPRASFLIRSLRSTVMRCLPVLALLPAGVLLAADPVATTAAAAAPGAPSMAAASIRMLGGLLVIIGAVMAGGRWLRRSRLLGSWKTSQARLQIVETRSVGQRQALCLVACDQREWLLAVGPAGIQMLAPIPSASLGSVSRGASFQEHLDGVAEFPGSVNASTPAVMPLRS